MDRVDGGVGKKEPISGYVLKVESRGFAKGLDMRERKVRNKLR